MAPGQRPQASAADPVEGRPSPLRLVGGTPSVFFPVVHPHPPDAPLPTPPWRPHLTAEDLPTVLAALDADDAVPVHLLERVVPVEGATGAGTGTGTSPSLGGPWCLELLATVEARPQPGTDAGVVPPWPVWQGVGAGGTVVPAPPPSWSKGRRRLLPFLGALEALGVGAHQHGWVTFVTDPTGVTLIAPTETVARLETKVGASFADARTPALDPSPMEQAAWAAAGLGPPAAYRWPQAACPLVARVRLAVVWRADRHDCAWLLWPEGRPPRAPEVWCRTRGVPTPVEDGDLRAAVRAVLGLLAAGGRPPLLTADEKRQVLAALVRRALQDGTPLRCLTTDLVANLLDEVCGNGWLRVGGTPIALPNPVTNPALDSITNSRRKRERVRQWLRDIGLPRWTEARTALAPERPRTGRMR